MGFIESTRTYSGVDRRYVCPSCNQPFYYEGPMLWSELRCPDCLKAYSAKSIAVPPVAKSDGASPPAGIHATSAQPTGIHATLSERGQNYGAFATHAAISQALKTVMHGTDGWGKMQPDQRECLEMVMHKIARLLNGNPQFLDTYRDCVGYLQLVIDRMLVSDGVSDVRLVKQKVVAGAMMDVT